MFVLGLFLRVALGWPLCLGFRSHRSPGISPCGFFLIVAFWLLFTVSCVGSLTGRCQGYRVPIQRQSEPIDKVVDVPQVWQTPVPMVQNIMTIDVSAAKQHQVPPIQSDRKMVEVHQSLRTYRVLDVLTVAQQQVPMCQKIPFIVNFPRCTRPDAGQVLTSRIVQT